MAAEVGGLLINLGLDVAQIKQDVGKAQREMSSFRQRVDRQMGKAQRSVRKLTRGFQGLVAVVGAQQLGAAIGRTLSNFEEINRQARTLGASTETIQELQFAFRQFGLQQQDVTDALATLSDRADEALSGTQSFVDEFERFGIEVDDLRGKSPGQLFTRVAEGISQLESEQKQVTAAVRIFGDEVGQRLLPLLTQGEEGIDRFAKRARELGVVVSDQLVKDSAKAAKDFRALKEVLTAQFASTVAQNAEELQTTANALMDIAMWGPKAASGLIEVGKNMQFADDETNLFNVNTLGGVNSELQRLTGLLDKIENSRAGEALGDPEKVERQIKQLRARRALLQKELADQAQSDIAANPGAFGFDGSDGGASAGGGASSSSPVLLGRVGRRGRGQSSYLADMVEIQSQTQKAMRETGNTFTTVQTNIRDNQLEVNQTFERTGDIVASSLARAADSGRDLQGVLQGLFKDLVRLQVQEASSNIGNALTNALSASFGGGAGSASAGVAASTPRSFAGGGYTGDGPRSGGLDGKGGFMALMHPRERVIDETRRGGGGDTIYQIDARGADAAAVARLERTIKAVNGSIERRAVNAVGSQRQRSFRG